MRTTYDVRVFLFNELLSSTVNPRSLRTAFPIRFTGSSGEIDDRLYLDRRHALTSTAVFEYTTPLPCGSRETVFITVKRKFSLHNETADRAAHFAFDTLADIVHGKRHFVRNLRPH